MKRLTKLFERGFIGNLELKNRLVMGGMGLVYTHDYINDRIIDFYTERAKGGVALMLTGGTYPIDTGRQFGAIAISDDKYIPGLKRLADAAHKHGAKMGVQLNHAGKNIPSALIGKQAISASPVLSNFTGEMPREATVDEIKEIVDSFGQAARRAKVAGLDVVELQAAAGYLIREFLSPVTNKRADDYGGEDIRDRMRFLLEIIGSIKDQVGDDFPLICRISGDEYLEGGNTLEEAKTMARELEKAGVHAISVAPGGHETNVPLTPGIVPKGAFAYLSQAIRGEVGIPVLIAYGFTDPFLAEEVLEDGKADFVVLARPLLADPEFPNKALEGRFEEIRRCVRCVQGCYDRILPMSKLAAQPATCLVNPATGRESDFEIGPAPKKKRVMVVGGGPAGMEAARILALRGHQVSLYEKEERLGGQLNIACVPPGKEEFQNITLYEAHQLEKLGVKIVLEKEVDADFVAQESPDAVVLATGATPVMPQIPGVEGENVVSAHQVLTEEVPIGREVVVVGGGTTGCETALFLAKKGAMDAETALFLMSYGGLDPKAALALTRKGREVTIVEMLPAIGRDFGLSRRGLMRRLLASQGVKVITEARVGRITDKGVEVVKNEERQTLEADTVVMAVGVRPSNGLYQELEGKVKELYLIGDGKEPRKAFEAIYEGAVAGREI